MSMFARLKALMRRPSTPPITQVSPAELSEYLPRKPIVVEAGAHIGIDTLAFAGQWPSGQIHALEPVPGLYDQLRRNAASFPNIFCYEMALAEKSGKVLLNLSEGGSDGSSSVLAPAKHLDFHPEVRFERSIEARSATIDDWAEEASVTRVDLLWLDLQGLEFKVLNASPRVLSTVSAVHTEVSLVESYRGCTLYPLFREWMAAAGFKVVRELFPYPDMGNVLFVRSK